MDNNVNYTVTANDLLSGKLQGMNAQAQSLEGTMGGLQGAITAAFSIYAITSFVSSVVSAGTTVENATTGLTTLLGDSAEAARVVRNEMEDAQKTPFAFEGLLAANKALIGAGIGADRARVDVLNLANAIAATGGGDDELGRMVVNMQQISNTGKATAQDIKQFAFAGVNIYKVLADATGKPISQVKEMEVSYDLLTMALAKAHEKGGMYYNGLENMAGNTSVRISNVGDAIFQFMNDIFVSSKPLIDGVLNSVLGLISGVRDLVGWFKEHKNVTEFLGVAIAGATSAFLLYTAAIKISALWTSTAMTSTMLYEIQLGYMIAMEGGATVATGILAGATAGLNAIMAANPIMLVVVAIGILIAIVYEVTKHFYEWGASITLLMGPIGWLISAIMSIYSHWKSIEDAFQSDGIIGGLKRIGIVLLDTILYPLQQAMEWVAKITGADWAKGAAESIKALRKNLDLIVPEETANKTVTNAEKAKVKTGGLAPGSLTTATGKKEKSKADGVSGTKVVNINVSIGNLINDFSIKTTNLQESTTAIKEKVIQALTGAINDSQIIAGQ